MATTSRRALWKGAISFGLVHIPVALHSAISNQSLDFDWLDKRSMEPVGYKRINKVTGKEVDKEEIVKGIEYEDGQYVVLSSDEIRAAYPKTTQTVEIEAFMSIKDIPFVYLERPYYISPINRGAKVYALLREVLHSTNKVGIAKVVIQTKQHLAVLMPCGPALILNLLRWSDEIRSWDELDLPAEGTASTGLTDKEMAMGEQLVDELTAKWKPEQFTDSFKEQILQLVKDKAEAGDTQAVHDPEEEAEPAGARIYDLTKMLQQSLNKGGGASRKKSASKAGTTSKSQTSTKEKASIKKSSKSSASKPAAANAKTAADANTDAKKRSGAKASSAKKATKKSATRSSSPSAKKSAAQPARKSGKKAA